MELGVGENRSRTGEKSSGLGFSLLLDNGHLSLNQPSLFTACLLVMYILFGQGCGLPKDLF